ncbi:FAD-dependent monooxygenase [uncultured Microbacterium sp.]|uniref:FAD-dependent oxidoreductase n=1 Tax=uncultured Microbacterium sp. TaxID=191216 RepID=UPI0028D6C971|nr:FAD-dependent monooxygenase [uncultured Microbacterium sp.]
MKTSVLIVGAGPTGLTLAAELQRRSVDCVIIDALEGPMSWDRATIVHPRTMELLSTVGLSDDLRDVGVHQRFIDIFSGGEHLGRMDLAEVDSPFAFNVNVSEEVTERALSRHLHAQGGAVRYRHRLTGMDLTDAGVLARIEHAGEEYELEAEWIVGCGGLHSPVRELSGIPFEGHSIAQSWAVVDTTLAGWPFGHETNFAFLDHDSVILTPLPELRWRAYIRPTSDTSDLVEDASAVVRRYAPEVSLIDNANPTRFHCHTKVATVYRRGRALLAGDAAHVCSPAQGHGMNSGIQDSFNLAWKLALVCHGEADPRLLDSYEAERRPVALKITASGDGFETMQTLRDDDARAERDAALRATFADDAARHREILGEAELDISYEDSPIIVPAVGGPAGVGAGHRLPAGIGLYPLLGTTHTAVVIGCDSARVAETTSAIQDAYEREIDTVIPLALDDPVLDPTVRSAADDLLGAASMTILVVRPDAYIGVRSDDAGLEPVRRYLDLVRDGAAS